MASKRTVATIAFAAALLLPPALAAQTTPASPSKTPRAVDGHPDLSGVWWGGADIGGRRPAGSPGPAPGRGGGRGPAPVTFSSLYQPSAQAEAKTLGDKDDPSLGCVPTAFGTLNVSLFDVGGVGQIIQTPKFMVMLTETYRGFQLIPFDGRPHRDDVPPSDRGDAIGRWDGDTFVVDKTNFNDTNWISAEGRISFHSDALHVVERYRRVDADTLEIEATLEDPKVLTKPWVVPKQTLKLAPFDQIMELSCSVGDTPALIEAATKQSSGKN
jgi:hypothetical protein